MPYSGSSDSSLPDNVKKMPAKKKKQWVAIFNDTYNSCIDDGGKTDSCETKAFKAANGTVKQEKSMPSKNALQRAWDNIIQTLYSKTSEQTEEIERAIGFSRLREQLWEALDNSEQSAAGWAYPIDIFVGDDGSSLFSIVTQNGKLYQVPMTLDSDNVSLGSWTQVTEVFEPVSQARSSFKITRDKKTGQHRWLFIAATSVINRVGEIDSTELFDSFVDDAAETGDFPRVDFYHLGESDPDTWEFGTADYLARDGFCYIATGLFDEDHPLARAAIKAYEDQPGVWGCSIEFYAKREAEIIVLDPKVQVPVYKKGKNTRISIVKEVDAAGLFTRVANVTEEKVRMKRDIMEVLGEFFGDDQAALENFAENVDTINRTVKSEGLIHRAKSAKKDPNPPPPADDDDDEEDTDDTEDTEEGDDLPVELDDEAIAQVAKVVTQSPEFVAMQQSLTKINAALDIIVQTREADAKAVAEIKKGQATLAKRLAGVEKEDTEKKQEWAEDLPARRTRKASYRPREEHDTESENEEDLANRAKQTLSKLPSY